MRAKRPDLHPVAYFQDRDLDALVKRLNRHDHRDTMGSVGGLVSRQRARRYEAFAKVIGSDKYARREIATKLAAKLDEGQGKYSDLGFDSKSRSFQASGDFNLALGLRPVDKMFAQILYGIENVIQNYHNIARRSWEERIEQGSAAGVMTEQDYFKGHAIEQRVYKTSMELLDFLTTVIRKSHSVPGRGKALITLAKLAYDYLDQGIANPHPHPIMAEMAKDIERIVRRYDNPSVAMHKIVNHALEEQAKSEREARQAERASNPRINESYLGLHRRRLSPRNGWSRGVLGFGIGPLPSPPMKTREEKPEPFAKTLSRSKLPLERSALGYNGVPAQFSSLVTQYENLDQFGEENLKQDWLSARAKLLKLKSRGFDFGRYREGGKSLTDCLKSLSLSSGLEDEALTLAFMVAEAKFNPSTGNDIEALKAIASRAENYERDFAKYYRAKYPPSHTYYERDNQGLSAPVVALGLGVSAAVNPLLIIPYLIAINAINNSQRRD